MRRFLYDAILILILVLIGLSLNDSTIYQDKQKELDTFQSEIKQGEVIVEKQSNAIMNQIDENNAANVAKSTSHLFSSFVGETVFFFSGIFESIVHTQ